MALLFGVKTKRRDYTVTKVKLDITKVWTQSKFVGNIQPASGRDLASAPEGNYSEGTVKVYSEVELSVKKSAVTGTYVLFENDWFEVVAKLPYKSGGPFLKLDHYKYLASPRTNEEVGL